MQNPTTDDKGAQAKPAWVLPVIVLAIVGALIAFGRKHDEVVENPIVDLAVITIGVFAFAAVYRVAAVKLGAPGAAVFFGAPATAPTN